MVEQPLEHDGSMDAKIVVIGGGFAGIAAATRLAESGYQISLIEQKSFLGGRTYSIQDRRTGDWVDNGQHVLMGCYHETFNLLNRLGTSKGIRLQKSLDINYRGLDGVQDFLRCPSFLPGPFHLLIGLIRMKSLGLSDILKAGRFGISLKFSPQVKHFETVKSLCRAYKQSHTLSELMWEPIALSALNEDPRHADAALFTVVLKQGFMGNAADSRMGIPVAPLSNLLGERAVEFIAEREGTVFLDSRVKQLKMEGNRISGVELFSGKNIPCNFCITAVPHENLQKIIARSELSSWISVPKLGSSPILSVYLWFEQPFSQDQICCLQGTTFEWIFHRSNFMNPGEHKQYCVCLVASAARKHQWMSRSELIQAAIDDVNVIYPNTKEKHPICAKVFWEPRATFSATPQNVRQRLGPGTSISNLFLAGDWTNTGLPATIEGAVVSGHRAADFILSNG